MSAEVPARRWIGRSIVAIGLVHTAFGLYFGYPVLRELAGDGIFASVLGDARREAAFWFFYLGFFAMLIGWLVDWMEARLQAPPLGPGIALLLLSLIAILFMPGSGWWLMLVPSIGWIIASRRGNPA